VLKVRSQGQFDSILEPTNAIRVSRLACRMNKGPFRVSGLEHGAYRSTTQLSDRPVLNRLLQCYEVLFSCY